MEWGIYTPLHMARLSLQTHVAEILSNKLTSSAKKLFSPADLAEIFTQIRTEWGLPRSLTLNKFRDLALETKSLQEVHLTSSYPLHTIRFHTGEFTPYELALSLRPYSYLSHGTAAFLHGLTDNQPEFVYVNQEQSAKEQSGSLTQAGLNRAFSGKQRQSHFIVTHNKTRIMLLSGKDTGRLGVEEMAGTQGETLELTNLERTLIDMTVRPGYAGGAENVMYSYSRAIKKISVDRLAEIIQELDYVYPFHQAIGFYLQRAGIDLKSLSRLRKLEMNYDFFLAHGMKKTKFDPQWRIHYPDDLPQM
jgi:predicted transcriptional regulator of viral defense system